MLQNERFADERNVYHIRKLLWADREFGRATVMVGSGFSRNAEPVRASAPPFPLWDDLASMMEAKVRGVAVKELAKRARRVTALRAASDFEHVFGRPALDDFLRETLADGDYLPADLHHSLLSLPWSDVFTTNYDTLLERARTGIVGRRYEVVVSTEDVPGTMKPRIVKLHGSFPSHRPFIITEEDYRTYPRRFAPFVNMVQQSMMENAFCLLGFSGDDPNFLEWTGWVRDNLGDATPTLYLVGPLDLSPWQRQVLAKRHVTAIDLGPLFPSSEWPQPAARHREALRWFLESLQNGVPTDPNDWPAVAPTPAPVSGRGPPPLPPEIVSPAPAPRPFGPVAVEDLEPLRSFWAEERRRYPGWLVCPADNRERLWEGTKYVYSEVVEKAAALPPARALALLFELAWRLERIEVPAYDPMPAALEAALQRVNPFPQLVQVDGALRPGDSGDVGLDWEELGTQWIELAFFGLKSARRSGKTQAFDRYWAWLDPISRPSPMLRARMSWEHCLQLLSSFRIGKLAEELGRWTPTPDLPLWEMRRGSLLAELGELKEAENVLTRALENIRARLGVAFADRELLSLEGWAMAALRSVSLNLGREPVDLRKDRNRWAQIERYGASPWDDLHSLREALKHVPPPPAIVEVRKTFDPGSYTITTRFSGDDDKLVGFQTLAVLERGGVPLRVGMDNTFGSLAEAAASLVVDAEPVWAVAMLVRSESSEALQAAFSRPRVVRLAPEEGARLMRSALDGLAECLTMLESRGGTSTGRVSLFARLVGTLSEILSRMTLRMSASDRAEALRLAERLYGSPATRQHRDYQDALKDLMRRTLDALPDEEFSQALPGILALAIPGEASFGADPDPLQLWPEPFEKLRLRERLRVALPIGRVNALLDFVRTGSRELRARAALRLAWLDGAGLLRGEARTRFGEALWSRSDAETGLPAETHFLPNAFLVLPAPPLCDLATVLRKYALRAPFPPLTTSATLPDGTKGRSAAFPSEAGALFASLVWMTTAPWLDASPRIAWSPGEARDLLDKARHWWSAEESHVEKLTRAPHAGLADVDRVLDAFVAMLRQVIAPFIDTAGRGNALRLVDSVQGRGIAALSARAALLCGEASAGDSLASQIRAGLAQDERLTAEDALDAVALWFFCDEGKGTFPSDLLDEVLNRILARRQPGARRALQWMEAIARRRPGELAGNRRKTLEVALEYLLSDTDVTVTPPTGERLAPFALEERPDYRALAAGIAGHLFAHASRGGAPPAPVLKRWEEVGQNDPLPEVRDAWQSAAADASV